MGAPFKEETADAHVLLREEEEGALLMIVLLRLVPHFLLFPKGIPLFFPPLYNIF